MGLKIKSAEFYNFRGIKKGQVIFTDNTVILGANNCGKTAIIEGIALALGRENLVHQVDDYDFYGGFWRNEDPLIKRFEIDITITGFKNNNPDDSEWFAIDRSNIRWWDAEDKRILNSPPEDLDENKGKRYFLAALLGCSGYYDEKECKYNVIRYFKRGACDPVAEDPSEKVPQYLLNDLGVFLLPSRRTWDKTLTFNASTFIKLLKENNAIPSEIISDLRNALSEIKPSPEKKLDGETTDFGKFIESVENELKKMELIESSNNTKLIYRPTKLDVKSLLLCLTPHLRSTNNIQIPLTHQGSGLLALQNMLLLIEFAKHRKKQGKNFIFLIEEPELHLYPSLQRRITQLARGYSSQTIVTTHSPHVASAYSANEVIVLKNKNGELQQETLLPSGIVESKKNLIKTYFYNERLTFCGSIMGSKVIVPEGKCDANWLLLIKNLAERYESEAVIQEEEELVSPSLFTIIKTKDARVVESVCELLRLGCKVIPLLDGDAAGKKYVEDLSKSVYNDDIKIIIRWDDDNEIEDIISWILEPCLSDDVYNKNLQKLFEIEESISLGYLKNILKEKKEKIILHEKIIDIVESYHDVKKRAWKLMYDLAYIFHNYDISNTILKLKWEQDQQIDKCIIFKYE
ncbi:MAG: ATP-dependent nuclease [Candidatus Helarchaeota archaeon]